LERLRHIREQSGYSQQYLADESGVSQHTISEIELGRRRPQGRTLRKLAKVLDVQVADFYEESEHPLGEASPSQQLTLNGALAEEWRAPTLRNQITLVNNLADYAEQEIGAREQEPKSETSLGQKMKRSRDAHWALAMMHVALELTKTFIDDPYTIDLVYDSGEVAELYRAHRRLDTAIDHTRGWFGENAGQTDVRDLDEYRRARKARDQAMEGRLGAGAS
jgi:transcriptional regulator with XRE-family HTH domain